MIQFTVVTPDGVVYEDSIEKVSIPTTTGQITVLQHHIPLLSIIAPGELLIFKGDTSIPLAVSGGIVQVELPNTVRILADTAERAEHIDIGRAEQARVRAEELMKTQKDVDDVAFARLQAKIEKELARVHVGRKYRKLPPA